MGLEKFRIREGARLRLKDHDPGDTGTFASKEQGKARLAQGVARLRELQDRLYAQDRWAVLVIFQAMDAAGKDSTIEHVMSGVNPQGTQVFSFKAPSAEELDHDFMWRTSRALPERGRIGIFNRSYYEEVLIVRVHPGILAAQKIPAELVGDDIWAQRFEDINSFERYLARNGTLILKFFLHVSREEQRRRFLARLDDPDKNWKFALGDVKEREHWDSYMRAYEEMIAATSTEHAPWYIIPADHKWFMRMAVADAIVEGLEGLKLQYPQVDEEKRKELHSARALLVKE
jgi:PPK2 family polyphosphate:nucleotide phosphotransferase